MKNATLAQAQAPETDNESTALILSGQGYELTISPEAQARKANLLDMASVISQVRDNDESGIAQRVSRSLAAMRIEIEKCRKIVKEPVNRIGKMIDNAAKEFTAEIDEQEARITKLIGSHAAEVARIRAEKEAEERRAADKARADREAAESAAAAAQSSGKIADIIAAKQAEAARQESLTERMAASHDVATTKVAEGVRFAWDFEVVSIVGLFQKAPALVRMEVKRAELLAMLKDLETTYDDNHIAEIMVEFGINAFKKPVVSSR